jgi:hypothetical protein
MDHYSRFIGLAFVIAWTILRLVRYLKAAARRSSSAVAPVASPTATSTLPASPIEAAGGGPGFLGGLLAVLVWLAGNAAVWGCLFLLPQLQSVPVLPRLLCGVLATLYLLYLARGAAAWVRRQSGRNASAGGDPIS